MEFGFGAAFFLFGLIGIICVCCLKSARLLGEASFVGLFAMVFMATVAALLIVGGYAGARGPDDEKGEGESPK